MTKYSHDCPNQTLCHYLHLKVQSYHSFRGKNSCTFIDANTGNLIIVSIHNIYCLEINIVYNKSDTNMKANVFKRTAFHNNRLDYVSYGCIDL